MDNTRICPICGKEQLSSRLVCFYCGFDFSKSLPLPGEDCNNAESLTKEQQLALKNIELFSQVEELSNKNDDLTKRNTTLVEDVENFKRARDVMLKKQHSLSLELESANKKCADQYDSGKRDAKASIKKSIAIFAIIGFLIAALCCTVSYQLGFNGGEPTHYAAGYEDGLDDGYYEGYGAGRDYGYEEGYAAGEDYGYDRGYDAGYDSGVADSYTPPSTSVSGSYIGNVNTGKFHRSSCGYLPYPENQVYFDSREDAIYAGYDPCQRCDP